MNCNTEAAKKPIDPSAPQFTDSQKSAIYTRGKNLLVSAGAGSGKTTVLTKRLIERIKAGESLSRFLVVTFMSSAAADIKRKLYDALLAESAENPDNTHLYREMLLVSEANICTISSYCLGFVKENFAMLGISPRVRVADETESAMMLRRVADDIITKGYEDEDSYLLLLSDNFSSEKSDDMLIEQMLNLFSALRVTLDWQKMLLDCADKLRADAAVIRQEGFFQTKSGRELRDKLKEMMTELVNSAEIMEQTALNYATDDKYIEPVQTVADICRNMCASLDKDYVNFCGAAYETTKTVKLYGYGCEKDIKDIVKKYKESIVKAEQGIYDRYCRGSEEYIAASYEKCAEVICAVEKFLTRLDSEYEEAKRDSGIIDYTDFERKALELLETTDENGNSVPTELCLKKQEEFDEILIDEYQDVNPMQDRIFALLAGKSHRFMVGDVKQSIYRFRNAYPDIFLKYKDEFPDISASDGSDSARIFLRENFRCAAPIIDYVNSVFENVTPGTSYAREYEGESLVHASARPERGTPVVVAVAKKEPKMAKEARQAEADYVAREILRLVNDELSDEGKPLRFSDFAVMMSAMKGYSFEYEKAFQKYGIPYKKEKSENFLENPDIRLAVSALKAIDNPTDDIALCALMRSPICNFTSDDLYRIRRNLTNAPFWEAVLLTASPSVGRIKNRVFRFKKASGAGSLCKRCREFVKILVNWRRESSGIPCCDFLKSFFVTSGILRISVSSGSRASLLLLYDYSRRFEASQNHGLSGFLDYLSELESSGKSIADAARAGDDDAVSFITVHKSKGLEYKVCFLVSADREFKGVKSSSDIHFVRGDGIYFRLRDRVALTTYDPMCNILAMDGERESAVGEELRKLYVALTRAKERLYVTGCAPSDWEERIYSVSSAKSWLELMLYVHQLGETVFSNVVTISEAQGEAGFIPPEVRRTIQPRKELLEIIAFDYPNASAVGTAAKISVSELREGLLEDDEYNRTHISIPSSRVALKPAFASQRAADAGDIGTANHLFMQFCDFGNAEKSVQKEAQRLLERRMITALQCEMLDVSALEKFFGGELYSRIKKSKTVYREKRFSVRDVISENNVPILVQGVIDCFFENPDGTFTVVDYKTDRVKTFDELVARHRVQLSCYKRAVERMTGRAVSETLLYSFALNGAVDVNEA